MIDLHIVLARHEASAESVVIGVYTDVVHAEASKDLVEAPYSAYVVSGIQLNKTYSIEAQHGNT